MGNNLVRIELDNELIDYDDNHESLEDSEVDS